MIDRIVIIMCKIKEMDIIVLINLDGMGKIDILIGIGFFDYMFDVFGCYFFMDLMVKVDGDFYIDGYYMVEDIGIVIG